MRLKIDNFAKLNEADILIDGITVIAGENNTGKSTVGKILFSLFNSISNISERVDEQRKFNIQHICRTSFLEELNVHDISKVNMWSHNIARKIVDSLDNGNFGKNEVKNIIENTMVFQQSFIKDTFGGGDNEINMMVDMMCEKIVKVVHIPDEVIKREIISRYFGSVFNNQMNSLINGEFKADLELDIKDKKINVSFDHNMCSTFQAGIPITRKAVYIDNPFIVDKLSSYPMKLSMTDNSLYKLLKEPSSEHVMDDIINSVINKEKLNEIYNTLNQVVDGKIIDNQSNGFYLEKEGYNEAINCGNLSTGLKSFVILKMLLERGKLTEKDVLILDEPEIHLHPQWQLIYAQLIVLIQKQFDLSVVVATHSPYFLDAINLFSVKYGTDDKVNYYLSSMEDNEATMECVTNNLDLIYKKMATPIQKLDTLRYELNNN